MLKQLLRTTPKLLKLGVLSVLPLLPLMSVGVQSATFDVKTLNTFNKLHDVNVSPDGTKLVYGVKKPAGDNSKKTNDLYLLSLTANKVGSKAKPQQITSHSASESAVQWSNTSDSLYFLAKRSGSRQVWRLKLSGGEATQVTDLPLDVDDFKLSPDNKSLVLAVTVLPRCGDFKCSKKQLLAEGDKKAKGMVFDKLMVRHWSDWETDYKSHLFVGTISEKGTVDQPVIDLVPGWNTDVPAKPFSGMEEVSFTADSLHVVFSAKQPGRDHAWQTNLDLFKVKASGGPLENLTEANKAWDSQPVFSKDGRFMAYLAMKEANSESDKFTLMLKDLKTGALKEVSPLWDRSASSFSFAADNRTIIATAQDVGQTSIFAISTDFGDVKKVHGQGKAGGAQLRGQTIYFTRSTLDHPTDVYAVNRDGSGLRQLTDINKDKLAGLEFGQFDQFDFKGYNDETVYGYWIKPTNFVEGKKYPIAFLVHGGPQGSFGNRFHSRWNAQLWAAAGYGVVMIDFHGSTGYGKAFTDSISRDWGGKPLEDLKKGMAHITQTQPWLDRDNACALGGSYGGYMMNWIEGNWPDGFKCLVNHAGLYDLKNFSTVTEELWLVDHEFGGPSWAPQTDYTKFNPADFVNNWKTPMLVIHGLKDFRVPYDQSLSTFTALQRKNIPSKLLIYPQENHWVLNKANLEQWYDEVFKWMDSYAK
jgi:dipeptidyl aminopeptidase/acylaminoacyl peptidase